MNSEPGQVEIIRRSDVATVVGDLATLALNAYVAMLALGVLHASYPVVPAVSFWNAAMVGVVLSAIGSCLRPSQRVWTKSKRGATR